MTTSDDFKKELKGGNIGDALKMALSEAIELKITTWVTAADMPENAQADQGLPGYRMQTRINILDGDIENEVGSLFVGDGPYTELREFHLQQVQEGHAILQQNLDSLKQLFGVLVGTLKQLSQPATASVDALPKDGAVPPREIPGAMR